MKRLFALTAAMVLGAAAPASATDYLFDAGPIFSGSFSFTGNTLTAFSGNLAGKVFDLSNTGYEGALNQVGGTQSGVVAIASNLGGSTADNDFIFVFDPASPVASSVLFYTTPGTGFANTDIRFTLVRGAAPEPATWAMLTVGFGAAGAAMRRRQKVRCTFA